METETVLMFEESEKKVLSNPELYWKELALSPNRSSRQGKYLPSYGRFQKGRFVTRHFFARDFRNRTYVVGVDY